MLSAIALIDYLTTISSHKMSVSEGTFASVMVCRKN